jgi:single-strand DNA-binding protein
MSNEFQGSGNIGQAPVLRTVKVNGENRSVADLRVYFDRSIPLDDGTYEDGGGFWLTVSVWGHRADSAVKLLAKGMRIFAKGSLRLDSWENDAGEEKSELRLTADHISIDPVCLDSVQLRKRNGSADETGPQSDDQGVSVTGSNQTLPSYSSEEGPQH